MPPYGEVGSDRHWGAGYAMAPLLSGDCAPLRDGAPYEIFRTIFLRVVTPLDPGRLREDQDPILAVITLAVKTMCQLRSS